MGIYIFNWLILKEYLEMDVRNFEFSNDFGKDVFLFLLDEGKKLMVYLFEGYWKDVGMVKSLWEVNMDLFCDEILLNLNDCNWCIYFVNLNELF